VRWQISLNRRRQAAKNPKRVANLVQSELLGRLNAKGLELEQSPVSMAGVAASADLVESGAISGKMLKDLYDLSFERNKDFPAVYEEEGRPQQVARHIGAGETCRRSHSSQSQAGGNSIAPARRRCWDSSLDK